MNKLAPWTDEEVNALNARQAAGEFHPYTCGSGNRKDAAHLDGEGVLKATRDGWECPWCDYRQNYYMVPGSVVGDPRHSDAAYLALLKERNQLAVELMNAQLALGPFASVYDAFLKEKGKAWCRHWEAIPLHQLSGGERVPFRMPTLDDCHKAKLAAECTAEAEEAAWLKQPAETLQKSQENE